ncbi:hypothetical protein [Hymenobacter negativus]|nr:MULTISPECIES: hypothetical protein [Bacteria]
MSSPPSNGLPHTAVGVAAVVARPAPLRAMNHSLLYDLLVILLL